MCDNRLRALYLKEWMAEVRATLGEWWRQGDSAASIPGFQSALEVPEREDAASTGREHTLTDPKRIPVFVSAWGE